MNLDDSPRGETARVLIVDDHPLVRAGLAQLVTDVAGLSVCGEAGTVEEAVRQVEATRPDLVLVDLSLAGGNGLRLIARIRDLHPNARMLVVSMHDETTFAERALRAGAMGYVEKREVSTHIVEAMRQVLAGRTYVGEGVRSRLVQAQAHATAPSNTVDALSNRELEVFELIGQGMTAREIAARLSRSVKTIETHREHIKHKLGLRSGNELTTRAIQWVLDRS